MKLIKLVIAVCIYICMYITFSVHILNTRFLSFWTFFVEELGFFTHECSIWAKLTQYRCLDPWLVPHSVSASTNETQAVALYGFSSDFVDSCATESRLCLFSGRSNAGGGANALRDRCEGERFIRGEGWKGGSVISRALPTLALAPALIIGERQAGPAGGVPAPVPGPWTHSAGKSSAVCVDDDHH